MVKLELEQTQPKILLFLVTTFIFSQWYAKYKIKNISQRAVYDV